MGTGQACVAIKSSVPGIVASAERSLRLPVSGGKQHGE